MVSLVIGVYALIINTGIRINGTGFQSGNCRAHLEGGAGGIGTCNRTVEQRRQLTGCQLAIVLIEGCQMIGRLVGQGKDFAVFHIYPSCCTAACTADALAAACQRFLCNLLQIDVQRQHHIVA